MKKCPCCLSDGLTSDAIKPDGLCTDCTEMKKCQRCGSYNYQEDMENDLCTDCFEFIEIETKSIEETNKCLDYGIL